MFGINYGTTPSDNTINYAKNLGVQFTELPFRPKKDWPGTVTTPTPPTPTPVPPPDTDPCLDVKAELANTKSALAALASENATLQQKIQSAKTALS
jgi:hypothetical protein